MTKTPFEILGLSDTASVDEVELRWKQLASANHPDKGGDAAKFIEYRYAYQEAKELAVEPKVCDTCQGKGKIIKSYGFTSMKVFCDSCGGTGTK